MHVVWGREGSRLTASELSPGFPKAEPEAARSRGGQALVGCEPKTTASLTPLPEPRGRGGRPPPWTLPSVPTALFQTLFRFFLFCFAFFLFAVYLFKHLQLPGAGGLRGSRVRTEVAVCICFLPPHLGAGEPQHGSSIRAPSPPPAARRRAHAVRFSEVPSSHWPVSPLAGTVAPGLSFPCKPEPIK